ncbi:MAG: NADPH-dependent glutamate synthase [Anaerorhabdus sp.]
MDILNKIKNPMQNAHQRRSNFLEVSQNYTFEMAQQEAGRCLNCPTKPCVSGCPVQVRIPEFIQQLQQGDVDGAMIEIKKTNSFPSVCGRVCPQEKQCEKRCVRTIKGEAVAIGALERFVGDNGKTQIATIKKNNKKVAIIGSGPAGLSCANDCSKAGFEVTVFEALHQFGGVLTYGIPEFRLPKEIVNREIKNLADQGVHFEKNIIIGKTKELSELVADGFQAIFIGSGAGLPRFMGIPNENASGVISANEYLTRCNLMKAYDTRYDTPIMKADHTIIVGGGNVAMDAARCAVRFGKKVSVIYRRDEADMPARLEEVHHAMEEGIEFHFLTNPVSVIKDESGHVCGIKCVKMEKKTSENTGKPEIKEIENSEFELECDGVIMAVGTVINPLLKNSDSRLKIDTKGCIVVDEDQMTSIENVYAGGDVVSGAATVIMAMGAGKKAAEAICKKLMI